MIAVQNFGQGCFYQRANPCIFQRVNQEIKNERVRYLNKVYQCFMAGKIPHKVKELVACGLKGSGKTAWASAFSGIIPCQYIASITAENQFACRMLKFDLLNLMLLWKAK